MGHLDGRQSRIEALLAAFIRSPLERLLDVSVVRTPKSTGAHRVERHPSNSRSGWPATYSKCAVSPRITAPRQITASNLPDAASALRHQRDLERARHPGHD